MGCCCTMYVVVVIVQLRRVEVFTFTEGKGVRLLCLCTLDNMDEPRASLKSTYRKYTLVLLDESRVMFLYGVVVLSDLALISAAQILVSS